jgi:hypothetical protein
MLKAMYLAYCYLATAYICIMNVGSFKAGSEAQLKWVVALFTFKHFSSAKATTLIKQFPIHPPQTNF